MFSFHTSFVPKAVPCKKKKKKKKKRWLSLDYWNCKWDLNLALNISAKKMKTSQHNSSNVSSVYVSLCRFAVVILPTLKATMDLDGE
jgi:hypothetical protein